MILFNKIQKNLNEDYTLEQYRFFLCCLFVFSLPFNRIYSELFLITQIILIVIDYKIINIKKIDKYFIFFTFFFIISLIGMFFTSKQDFKNGSFLIEKQLAILLLPLILLFAFEINKKRITIIFNTLITTTTIAIIYLIISNFLLFKEMNISFREYIYSDAPYNHSFSSSLEIHASYLSMYILLSITYIIKKIINKKSFLLICLLLVQINALFFLASRINTFIFILLLILIIPLFNTQKRKKIIVTTLIGFVLFSVLFVNSPFLKEKYGKLALNDIGIIQNEESKEPRITRWIAALEIINQAPLFGFGTGSEITVLKEKYKEKGLIYSYYKEYNVHNQYLSLTIKHGIIGLLISLSIIFIYFKIALKSKDYIYLSFLIIILFNFLVENILDTNKGIFFFAFFNTLMGYYNLNIKNETTNISNNPVV